MTAKKFFIITMRIFFVLLSLKFVRDAFYKSDGYLFYLNFREFLPDLSLVFIFWTILGIILASVFWLITFGTHKILPKPLKAIRFEHITVWLILLIVIFFAKENFGIHLSTLRDISGLNNLMILVISGLLITAIVWLGRKYTEKILYKLNTYISPLVWIFVFLLILALPFSFSVFKRGMSESKKSNNSSHISYPEKKRPNILFVTWDAVIAKNLQAYGFNLPTTPFLLEWAKDAMVFKKAYSASNWTTPATMSMMTSQRPWTHRISHLFYLYPFRSYKDSLPGLLKDYGYATYAFVNNYNGHPDSLGLRNAFLKRDKYDTFWSIPKGLAGFFVRATIFIRRVTNSPITAKWTLEHPLFIPLQWVHSDTDKTMVPVENVYNHFLEYVSQKHFKNKSQQPFFAWLHVEPPHLPFLPPKPYMGMFGDAERFNTYNKQEPFFGVHYPPEKWNEKDVEILRKRYYEYILYCDQEFKSFISRLDEVIDMSNTIIIFSADHGTSLSRGFIGHAHKELWEFLVNIPLIIKIPRGKDGRIIDMPIEQIDIAPTILEFAGIPAPGWMEGRSLVPLLEGKSLEPRPLFTMQLEHSRLIGNSQFNKFSVAVWDGDYKLIYFPGWKNKETLLFNLKSDPDEEKNIYHERPEVALKLMKLIEDNLLIAKKRITQ